jgi:hypothetical protein
MGARHAPLLVVPTNVVYMKQGKFILVR